MVPTFTREPFDGVGTQLCPCSIATATPQAFTVASPPATSPGPGVPRRRRRRVRAATQPISARFRAGGFVLRGVQPLVPHVYLSVSLADPPHLAVLARPVVVEGCCPPTPTSRRIGLPSASTACCDRPAAVSFHHRTVRERLVALDVRDPQPVRRRRRGTGARPGPPAAPRRRRRSVVRPPCPRRRAGRPRSRISRSTRAAGHRDALPVELQPHLAGRRRRRSSRRAPGGSSAFSCSSRTCPPRRTAGAGAGVVVGGRGDRAAVLGQHGADRLDPQRSPPSVRSRARR